MTAAAFNFLGIPVGFFASRSIPGIEYGSMYVSMAAGIAIFVALAAKRLKGKVGAIKALFVLNAAFVSFALWHVYSLYYGQRVIPFQAAKLGALVAAMLAPGILTGVTAVGIHIGAGVVQYLSYPLVVRHSLQTDEPWALLAFWLAAVLILLNRLRARQTELEMARAQAETESRQRLADAFLEIRDLMNTPVQSIELAATLLLKDSPGQKEILDRLMQSCELLNDLNLDLKRRHVSWGEDATKES